MTPLLMARSRYTAKHYDRSRKISAEDLRTILEILRLAPSAINLQPWRFHVFDGASIPRLMPYVKDFNIERVRDASHVVIATIERNLTGPAWTEKMVAQETADGRLPPDPKAADALRARRRASIAFYCSTEANAVRWASEQVHLAFGFLMPCLFEMGIDSTLLGGILFEDLDRAMGWDAAGQASVLGISLGYRAENDANAARPKSRFPFDEVVDFVGP